MSLKTTVITITITLSLGLGYLAGSGMLTQEGRHLNRIANGERMTPAVPEAYDYPSFTYSMGDLIRMFVTLDRSN